MTVDDLVRLVDAGEAGRFGAKAANLARARRARLNVPDGWVLGPAAARAPDGNVLTRLVPRVARWGGPLAVRSSAIGEDGAAASYAGQQVTRLGVRATEGALRAAILAVTASALSPHALAYRRVMDPGSSTTGPAIPVAVLIQPLIPAEVSGVLFTRNPVTGDDELVIEAARGLGETVVSGRVTPELCRVSRAGIVLEQRHGRQEVAVVAAPGGGTAECPLTPSDKTRPCLDAHAVMGLAELAGRCRGLFAEDALDLEWAVANGLLVLLQCRPMTA